MIGFLFGVSVMVFTTIMLLILSTLGIDDRNDYYQCLFMSLVVGFCHALIIMVIIAIWIK
jgi:hypothetical protein